MEASRYPGVPERPHTKGSGGSPGALKSLMNRLNNT